MIVTGFKKDLTKEDMWDIDPHEQCNHLTDKLERVWKKSADEYMRKVQIELEEHERKGGKADTFEPKTQEPSLAFCLVKIFAGKFLAGAFLKLIQDRKRIFFSQQQQKIEINSLTLFFLLSTCFCWTLYTQVKHKNLLCKKVS